MSLIDEICPSYIGDQRIKLTLSDPDEPTPRAFTDVSVDVDYTEAFPEGIVLPMVFSVAAPSAGGFQQRIITRSRPSQLVFRPREGGIHLVRLAEIGHNKWWGSLIVNVTGDTLVSSKVL